MGATSTIRIARAAALGVATLIGSGLSSPPARAAFTVTLEQEGSNVVATGSGSINTAALGFVFVNTISALVCACFADILTGSPSNQAADTYTGFTGPGNFGDGSFVFANSGSGDKVGIFGFDNELNVPQGYVSKSLLSDTSTYDNQTLASLGVTPGTYTWTWGSGATKDSFILDIVAPTSVPEPASLPLLVMGFAGLGMVVRMRRA
jgi:PEP-CTERM motif-containing protein